MNLASFESEVRRFLCTNEPEVLVITGKWGVGKTFGWNRIIKDPRLPAANKYKKYSYVSLFGLGGLADLKAAVFPNTVPLEHASEPADAGTFDKLLGQTNKLIKQGTALANASKIGGDFTAIVNGGAAFLIKDQIICIDDLARRSDSLAISDVLGFVSYLKEQRGCKVVILLNDEELGDRYKDFKAQLEKVADVSLRFAPTALEATDIGLAKATLHFSEIAQNCVLLNITNIRTIKRIERVCNRLVDELHSFDSRIAVKAIHSAVLFVYSKYQPHNAPNLEFIKNYNSILYALSVPDWLSKNNVEFADNDEKKEAMRQNLRDYEFDMMTDFDFVILHYVETGHLESTKLLDEAAKLAADLTRGDQATKLRAAWHLYNGCFDDNAQDIAAALNEAIRDNPKIISGQELSGAVSLIKEIVPTFNTSDLIEFYVEKNGAGRGHWDLTRMDNNEGITDCDVRAAFTAKLETFPQNHDFENLLIELGQGNGWNPEDITFLASRVTSDYVSLFRKLKGDALKSAVRGGLKFVNVFDTDPDTKKFTGVVAEAFQVIGEESLLNRRRLTGKGVILPPHCTPNLTQSPPASKHTHDQST